jgi:outer membrane lipoprotein-sorting protein
MRTSSRSLALVVSIFSFALPLIAQPQRKPDAKRILNNMFRAYSRLASYRDEGILVTTNDEPTGGTIEKMPFKTFFKRPNLFRFEWTEYGITKLGRVYLIWCNGKEAFTYWEPDRYEKNESLSSAIAGATGVSSGAASNVSVFLMPEKYWSSPLQRLVNVSLLGEDVFEGVRCYHIKAAEGEDLVELWVGKTDFLLHKLRQETRSREGVRIKEEIRRKIQVDQAIPEIVFNYKPPIPLTPPKDPDIALIEKLLHPGPPVWSEFRSDEGRFNILMPEKPVPQTSTFETKGGRFVEHTFTASHGLLVCVVGYMDIPKQSLSANNVDILFDSTRDTFIKAVGGKLASENPLSLDGHTGREIKALLFQGEVRLRQFLVDDRLYQLYVMKADNVVDSDAEIFSKFFASFKLIPPPKSIEAFRVVCFEQDLVFFAQNNN